MGLESEKFLKDYCGVLGVVGPEFAADYVAATLEFLQHRGQDSAGVVSFDKKTNRFYTHKDKGLTSEVFTKEMGYQAGILPGKVAIGHVRYSTVGNNTKIDAQPIVAPYPGLAMAHNGDITNSDELENLLEKNHIVPCGMCDAEYLLHTQSLILKENLKNGKKLDEESINESINYVMKNVGGAYSVVEIIENKFVAFRDPLGFKPLVWGDGEFNGQKTYVFASESLPITQMGLSHEKIRNVLPGNAIIIDLDNELKSSIKEIVTAGELGFKNKSAFCGFEWAYFSHSASWINNQSVVDVRERLGQKVIQRFLDKGYSIDIIGCVPDTSRSAAKGASEFSGIPFDESIILKNRYESRRSFIEPKETIGYIVDRKLLFNPWRAVGKIGIFDDSIVRGTTMEIFTKHARDKLKKIDELHLLITYPQIFFPCFYGINMKTHDQFIARKIAEENYDEKQIIESLKDEKNCLEITNYVEKRMAEILDINSVTFNTIDDYCNAVKNNRDELCMACLDGNYPARKRNNNKQ